jgi:hypothetical protein
MGIRLRRVASVLHAAYQALRLAGRVPGLMFSAATRYRAFEGAYVRAAGEEGMPAPLAKELVRAMRPGNLWKDWRGSKSPVTAPSDPINDRDIAWQPAQPARRRHGG